MSLRLHFQLISNWLRVQLKSLWAYALLSLCERYEFKLMSLRCHFATSISFCSHFNFMSITLQHPLEFTSISFLALVQCRFDFFSTSLQFHLGITSFYCDPLRCHFGCDSMSFRHRLDALSMSCRCHFDVTSNSLRLHVKRTPMPLGFLFVLTLNEGFFNTDSIWIQIRFEATSSSRGPHFDVNTMPSTSHRCQFDIPWCRGVCIN